jgi:hypothetical protein
MEHVAGIVGGMPDCPGRIVHEIARLMHGIPCHIGQTPPFPRIEAPAAIAVVAARRCRGSPVPEQEPGEPRADQRYRQGIACDLLAEIGREFTSTVPGIGKDFIDDLSRP